MVVINPENRLNLKDALKLLQEIKQEPLSSQNFSSSFFKNQILPGALKLRTEEDEKVFIDLHHY
jgi:hypothetical protein